MSAFSDLLETPSDAFVRKTLPAASYLCQLVKAEILPGMWKANDKRPAKWFISYVPTVKIIDVIPSGDPEQDEQVNTALTQFGDWQGKELRYAQMREIPGYSEKKLCVGIEMARGSKGSGLNYMLAETSEGWADKTGLAESAARFYTATNSHGRQDGWVVTTLSKEPNRFVPIDLPAQDDPAPLKSLIPSTEGAYLVVDLVLEKDESGQYDDKVMCGGTSSVAG